MDVMAQSEVEGGSEEHREIKRGAGVTVRGLLGG